METVRRHHPTCLTYTHTNIHTFTHSHAHTYAHAHAYSWQSQVLKVAAALSALSFVLTVLRVALPPEAPRVLTGGAGALLVANQFILRRMRRPGHSDGNLRALKLLSSGLAVAAVYNLPPWEA